jgi:LPXTG-site transpeptidase (sortase) family protein
MRQSGQTEMRWERMMQVPVAFAYKSKIPLVGRTMKNLRSALVVKIGIVGVLVVFVIFSSLLVPYSVSAADGKEYYIPGGADQLFQILKDIDNDPDLGNAFGGGGSCTTAPCNQLHNVITVVVGQNNAMIYYDHWENGYLNGAAGDETYTANKGNVLTFISDINIPRAAGNECSSSVKINMTETPTTACYDGQDRIYVVGSVSVVQAFWPAVTQTVFANAWEIYPVSALANNYTIPVGENLAVAPTNYLDFDQTFVLVQAVQDNTHVQINNPAIIGMEVDTTLNRGEIAQLFHIDEDTTVTSNLPVYAQLITGRFHSTLSSESRSHSVVPRNLWKSSFYSPVPGFSGGYDTDIFIFNPNGADLTINYEDQVGTGSFVVPPHSTRSYQSLTGRFVPPNSAVYLEAEDQTIEFWAIGSVDTESAAYNYGFSLIPSSVLSNNYYLGWAPGTTDLSANGSPVFVTPTKDNTTIYVDFGPFDGVVDATYVLNRIQVQRVFDPDIDNTGMHIWATNPIAIVWGEDPSTASPGNPFIDAGYTVLPTQEIVIPIPTTPTPTSHNGFLIPVTGFKPNVVTDLSRFQFEVYTTQGDVTLEIPSLGVNISVVGVPLRNGEWNVAWLGKQAGWLEGSAFPSWRGNSVLTAHSYLSSGNPGPFANLNRLKFGDKVIVHAYGQQNIFEVHTNLIVRPDDRSVMKHEELPWITLVTCKGYDEKTDTYLHRIVVRAVLVDVRPVK